MGGRGSKRKCGRVTKRKGLISFAQQHAAQMCRATAAAHTHLGRYSTRIEDFVGRSQHGSVHDSEDGRRRAPPLPHREQFLARAALEIPQGHFPVLGPLVDRTRLPADAHDDQLTQARVELRGKGSRQTSFAQLHGEKDSDLGMHLDISARVKAHAEHAEQLCQDLIEMVRIAAA